MDEFALIREVVKNLGEVAQGRWVELGPGDDAAVIAQIDCQPIGIFGQKGQGCGPGMQGVEVVHHALLVYFKGANDILVEAF